MPEYTYLMLFRDVAVAVASIVASVSAAVVAYAVAARYRYDRAENENHKNGGDNIHRGR